MRRNVFVAMSSGILSAALMFFIFFVFFTFFHNTKPASIGTVDLRGLVREFSVQAAKKEEQVKREKHLKPIEKVKEINRFQHSNEIEDTERLKLQARRYSVLLEQAITIVAKSRHLVLLPKEAVIIGAPDETHAVKQVLHRLLRSRQ